MRAVIQRVRHARVRVSGHVVGEIGDGLLVLIGFGADDAEGDGDLRWAAEKLWGLRVFADDAGRMNRSAEEAGHSILIVSQFTLYGDVARGRRPSFTRAAAPEVASARYDRFVELCAERGPVQTGEFGAMMEVELLNDGPVTLILER